ncbi:unnamed protein product, partial [Adineta steineri]
MAMANNKTQCFKCNKDKITYPCEGCSQRFCLMDLTEHKQILNDELNNIANDYDEFKEIINDKKQNHSLIEQINEWEVNSIEIIRRKAQNCREIVIEHLLTFFNDIEMKFNDLSEQIKQIRHENEFKEVNLNYLKNQLIEITEILNNRSYISIQQNSQSFINEILIIISKKPKWDKWEQNAITVAAGNGNGQKLNQLNFPYGIFIDEKKNIFIADHDNYRVLQWKYNAKKGQTVAGGNGQGNSIHQLNCPTDGVVDQQNHSIIIVDYENRRVIQRLNGNQQILIENIDCFGLAMDKSGFLYVSDYKKNEVRRWKMGEYNNEGIIVAGGNGQGNQLNQLNCPGFIFVDKDQSNYVSDRENNRVMKWRKDAKEGTIVAGGNGLGKNLDQLFYPQGVIVDSMGQIYVADCWNHRVVRWCEGKEKGEIVVGGNGEGNETYQLNHPFGLSFDDEGSLYVAELGNHRIDKFQII